jgi:hypothetical protein
MSRDKKCGSSKCEIIEKQRVIIDYLQNKVVQEDLLLQKAKELFSFFGINDFNLRNVYSTPAASPTTLDSGNQVFVANLRAIIGFAPPLNTPSVTATLTASTTIGGVTLVTVTSNAGYTVWNGTTYNLYVTAAAITGLVSENIITASGPVYTINPGYTIEFIGQY